MMSNSTSTSTADAVTRPPAFLHRIFRGVDGLLAPYRTIDNSPAEAILPPPALPLFQRMSQADRAHCLRVLKWLQAHGHQEPDILIAGLLHDCGKAEARLGVWHRTLKVFLRSLAPWLWRRLSRPAPAGSWRYPFYILRTHPARGARLAAEAGCSALTVWLIEYHEVKPDARDPRYRLMRALQDADGSC